MKKTLRHILARALAAAPLACAALLASCSFDDDYDGGAQGGKGPVAVKLSVTAGEPGDLNGTRAAGDLVEGGDGEFMHTLRVYIVKLDAEPVTTVLDLSDEIAADFAQNPLAESGNVKRWNFDDLSLAPGRYAAYAFANIEDYSGVFDSPTSNGTQTATGEEMLKNSFTEGYLFRDDNLNSYRLTNPAGAIDFAGGKFIPMSARYEFTISGDLNSSGETVFSIGLDRLVTKVQLQLGEEGQAQLPGACSLSFENYAQNVPLMAEAVNTSTADEFASYYGTRTSVATVDNVSGGQPVAFYVNETPAGEPFTVSLSTMSTTGITSYTSKTVRDELPRNMIYPLTLNFPDYAPDFNWQAWLAPIAEWVEVEVDYDTDTYIVKVPEGAKFDFSLNGVTSSTGGTVAATAVWNVPESTERWFTNYTNADGAVSGYISATGVGTQLPLSVTVSWQQGDNTLNRKYNVIVELIDMTDVDYKTRAGGEQSRLLTPEVLNMFIKR